MKSVIAYLWGSDRSDVMTASAELTGNIQILEMIAPKNIETLTDDQKAALIAVAKQRGQIINEAKQTGKGYLLFAEWLLALHAYAEHTG